MPRYKVLVDTTEVITRCYTVEADDLSDMRDQVYDAQSRFELQQRQVSWDYADVDRPFRIVQAEKIP